MRLLLDTHAFLWYITDDPRLSAASADAIRDEGNDIFLSVVSVWETLRNINSHLLRLPLHHRDPFDRMLICQALQHDLVVVTSDGQFEKYPVRLFH